MPSRVVRGVTASPTVPIRIEAYRTLGDADDVAAVLRARDAMLHPTQQCKCLEFAGTLACKGPLDLHRGGPPTLDGWMLRGFGPSSVVAFASGAASVAPLGVRLCGSIVTLRDFSVVATSGHLGTLLQLSIPEPRVGRGSTQHVTIAHVRVGSVNAATVPVDAGFGIGNDTAGDVSEVKLLDCTASHCDVGFALGDGRAGNVLDVAAVACTARNGGTGVAMRGSGLTWSDGNALGNRDADFFLELPPSAPVRISGVRSEGSRQLWRMTGNTTFSGQVALRDCLVPHFTHPEGIVIEHRSSTPLLLESVTAYGGPEPARVLVGGNVDVPTPFAARNCGFDNANPFGFDRARRDLISDIRNTHVVSRRGGPVLTKVRVLEGR